MSSIRTLVLLKYEILTTDEKTWSLCETYPVEVRKNWAWRCALDVEHLVAGDEEAEYCIEVAKKYRDGLANYKELNRSYNATAFNSMSYHSAHASYAASLVAAYDTTAYSYYAAYAVDAAANAGRATLSLGAANAAYAAKWVKYIEWLIEELCIWEEKQ